jgi:hypothetical protein
VVLPDKDRSDADVVVFLAEEHAAANDTDAQQRGAVRTSADRQHIFMMLTSWLLEALLMVQHTRETRPFHSIAHLSPAPADVTTPGSCK